MRSSVNVCNGVCVALTGVRAHVAEAVGGGAEGLAAEVALVVALASVDAPVDVQRVAPRELLAAKFALKLLLQRHNKIKPTTSLPLNKY